MTKLTKKQQAANFFMRSQSYEMFMDKLDRFVDNYIGPDFYYEIGVDLKNTEIATRNTIIVLSDEDKKELSEICRLMVFHYLTDNEDDYHIHKFDNKGYSVSCGKCDDCGDIHCRIEYTKPIVDEEPSPIVEDITNPQE